MMEEFSMSTLKSSKPLGSIWRNFAGNMAVSTFLLSSLVAFHGTLIFALVQYVAIDVVIGGPPCIDFSMVNAYRKGVQGRQGMYFLDFGNSIRTIERLQSPHPLFFLAENVILKGDDLEAVREAFGFDWDPIRFDSKYISPARRDRHFVSNVSTEDLAGFDYQGLASEIGPDSCLDPDFHLPAHVFDPEMTAKVQCLMGSASRIDDRTSLRMYVFNDRHPVTANFHCRPLNGTCMRTSVVHSKASDPTNCFLVSEREKLMGYPVGYVERPGASELIKRVLSHFLKYLPRLKKRLTRTASY
jgi:C-5 cytosine-specific DNA methylase